MAHRLGAVTIGQSPRSDITDEITALLPHGVELTLRGALDDIDERDVDAMDKKTDDNLLVTKLRGGRQVTVAKRHLIPLIKRQIAALTAEGVSAIVMLCTGDFGELPCDVPLIYPADILSGVICGVGNLRSLGVLVPEEYQVGQFTARWRRLGADAKVIAASPYRGMAEIESAAARLRGLEVDAVVLDCIGYSVQMKSCVADITGRPVILSRTILARVLAEMFG